MPKGNPQLADGYTKIANDLLDAILLCDLTKHEFKITVAIIRKTYGWNKKVAAISVSTFQVMTGIDRRHVARAIKSLIDQGYIGRVEGAKMKYGKPVYNYWIIKKSYCQYGNRTIANTATEAIANRAHIKDIKDNLNKGRKKLVDNFTMPS